MADQLNRLGAMWSPTLTLGYIRDPLTDRLLLNQLWIDAETGLTEWRLVPMVDPNAKVERAPAVVMRVRDEPSDDDVLALEDEE